MIAHEGEIQFTPVFVRHLHRLAHQACVCGAWRRSSSPLHPAAATARDTMRGGVLPARIEAQRSEAPSTMREVEHGVTVAGR
jgi:hypothetical protein